MQKKSLYVSCINVNALQSHKCGYQENEGYFFVLMGIVIRSMKEYSTQTHQVLKHLNNKGIANFFSLCINMQ